MYILNVDIRNAPTPPTQHTAIIGLRWVYCIVWVNLIWTYNFDWFMVIPCPYNTSCYILSGKRSPTLLESGNCDALTASCHGLDIILHPCLMCLWFLFLHQRNFVGPLTVSPDSYLVLWKVSLQLLHLLCMGLDYLPPSSPTLFGLELVHLHPLHLFCLRLYGYFFLGWILF